ncbi:MAG: DUF4248 domain-containing protein [Bacteroidales bacterium]|nr:DUF4248 domain-containing protein [Bacteroidales bacterium]
MKAMYKYELAELAGVSRKTLTKWISERISSLDPLFTNYNKYSKLLTPAQVESLAKHYCIIIEL